MCDEVEREWWDVVGCCGDDALRCVGGDDQRFVREVLEGGVAGVDCEDDGAAAARIRYPFQQRRGRVVGRDDDDRLTAACVLEPGESDGEMRRRFGGWLPADEGRRKLGDVEPSGFVVQMSGQMPRFGG